MAKKELKENKEKKHFFRDFKAELKKVIWPTPKQLLNNTVVVVALVLITALIVFILDLCFDSVNKYGITKLQSIVQNSTSTENNVSDESNEEEKSEDDIEETTNTENAEVEQSNQENEENNQEAAEENNQEPTTESNE